MARKPPRSKRYSVEFKANAVRLANESEKPIAEVARDLGVPYQTLYQWVSNAGNAERRASVNSSTRGGAPESAEEEARRLRRELEEVKRERDFLKKAAAFFAQVNK
jgi:transposase